tara:strand:+ start:4027 stop:4548 length:522 start_codon:yes stop_codon:yes gene_type:complete
MSNIKQIILPNLENNKNKKTTNKRKIVNTELWETNIENIDQFELIKNLKTDKELNNAEKLVQKNIITKIQGYKNQDIKKKIYNEELFIDNDYVVKLLCESNLLCNYCKETTYLLYENVKQSNQWSLDRLDNKIGHNIGNVVISCLDCNIKRKTMHFKRFEFTKQLQIIKNEEV